MTAEFSLHNLKKKLFSRKPVLWWTYRRMDRQIWTAINIFAISFKY